MTSKRLTPEEVHAVGRAAVENALQIMGEALVLLGAGRARRAYALGVIAVEEVAKYLTCREELRDWAGPLTVPELNGKLRPPGRGRAHVERYIHTLSYLAVLSGQLPEGWNDLEAVAKSDMRARERALYVEVHDSGVPMTPEGVSFEEARMWVEGMARFFATLGNAWQEGLDVALEEARGGKSRKP